MKKKHDYWKAFKANRLVENRRRYCHQAALCKKIVFEYEKCNEDRLMKKSDLGAFIAM